MGDCATRGQAKTKLAYAGTVTNTSEYVTKDEVIAWGGDASYLNKYISGNELVALEDIILAITGDTVYISYSFPDSPSVPKTNFLNVTLIGDILGQQDVVLGSIKISGTIPHVDTLTFGGQLSAEITGTYLGTLLYKVKEMTISGLDEENNNASVNYDCYINYVDIYSVRNGEPDVYLKMTVSRTNSDFKDSPFTFLIGYNNVLESFQLKFNCRDHVKLQPAQEGNYLTIVSTYDQGIVMFQQSISFIRSASSSQYGEGLLMRNIPNSRNFRAPLLSNVFDRETPADNRVDIIKFVNENKEKYNIYIDDFSVLAIPPTGGDYIAIVNKQAVGRWSNTITQANSINFIIPQAYLKYNFNIILTTHRAFAPTV